MSTTPRLISDTECAQRKCASTTTGCWGECNLKRNPFVLSTNAQFEAVKVAEPAKDHAVQQAQNWAMEAKTQRETVLSILRYFGLPEHDWEALRLISAKVAAEPSNQATSIDTPEFSHLMCKLIDALQDMETSMPFDIARSKLVEFIDERLANVARLSPAPVEALTVEQRTKIERAARMLGTLGFTGPCADVLEILASTNLAATSVRDAAPSLIPVTERLPHKATMVLVTDGADHALAYQRYDLGETVWYDAHDDSPNDVRLGFTPTHWAKVPIVGESLSTAASNSQPTFELRANAGPEHGDGPVDRMIAAAPLPQYPYAGNSQPTPGEKS